YSWGRLHPPGAVEFLTQRTRHDFALDDVVVVLIYRPIQKNEAFVATWGFHHFLSAGLKGQWFDIVLLSCCCVSRYSGKSGLNEPVTQIGLRALRDPSNRLCGLDPCLMLVERCGNGADIIFPAHSSFC